MQYRHTKQVSESGMRAYFQYQNITKRDSEGGSDRCLVKLIQINVLLLLQFLILFLEHLLQVILAHTETIRRYS